MWTSLIACSFLFVASFAKVDENANLEYYTAGVVEYGNPLPKDDIQISGPRYVAGNLHEYLRFIEMAKHEQVDILVFPEATLNYFETRKLNIENSIELPNPDDKIAPYQHINLYSEVLRNISKSCKNYEIYVLVNLVEKVPCNRPEQQQQIPCKRQDGYNLYNTNVVFDRLGRVISKYQKYNLFMEPDMDVPETVQYATFSTDFKVQFGHFVCFDIMFMEPAERLLQLKNVSNILYSSMWFSELPFLTAVQMHSGWAYAHNVNLISSGANNPQHGSTGSGIYLGRNSFRHKIISPKTFKTLIVTKVPKEPKNILIEQFDNLQLQSKDTSNTPTINNPKFTPTDMKPLKITEKWSELGDMKWDIEDDQQEPQRICAYTDVCCEFDIKMKHIEVPPGKLAYKYKLVANSTTRKFGTERIGGEIYCAIISCRTSDPKSCGRHFNNYDKYYKSVEFKSIKITANVRKAEDFRDVLMMPNTLDLTILPLETNQFSFDKLGAVTDNGITYDQYRMESKGKLQDLLTFGIYGRNFAYDQRVPQNRMKG